MGVGAIKHVDGIHRVCPLVSGWVLHDGCQQLGFRALHVCDGLLHTPSEHLGASWEKIVRGGGACSAHTYVAVRALLLWGMSAGALRALCPCLYMHAWHWRGRLC